MRVACACVQRGSAAGLAPVLHKGVAEHGWVVDVLAHDEARKPFEARSLPTVPCYDNLTVPEALAWLGTISPDIVVTGSDATRAIERNVIRAASLRHNPSVCFVDYWSNYESRFIDVAGCAFPDDLVVLDDFMAQGLVAVGISQDRIHITGSPAIENSVSELRDSSVRRSERAANGIAEQEFCVLFASSPGSAEDFGRIPVQSDRAHSLRRILEQLVGALDDFSFQIGRKVSLIIRPHPRESASSFTGLAGRYITVRVTDSPDSLTALRMADLAVGLDTMLLVEALAGGKPVLGIGYVRPLNDGVAALFRHAGLVVDAPEDFAEALNGCLDSNTHNFATFSTLFAGATQRVVDVIHTRQ